MLSKSGLLLFCVLLLVFAWGCGTQTPKASEPTVSVSPFEPARGERVLNGPWQFQPAVGASSDAPQGEQWGTIRVPGSWTPGWTEPGVLMQVPQNEFWEDYFGMGEDERGQPKAVARKAGKELELMWYQREIEVPEAWAGRAISVDVRWLSTDAQVFVDDQEAGTIEWPTGQVDITEFVEAGGKHTLRMKVAAIADQGFTWSSMGTEAGMAKREKKGLASRGLVGDVLLISRPKGAVVTDVFVKPSTRKQRLTLDVEVSGVQSRGTAKLTAKLVNAKGLVEQVFTSEQPLEAKPTQRFEISWDWADPRFWEYADPHLYTLQLKVTGAGVDDIYAQRFGFREIWIEGRDIFLNGKPFRLRPFGHGLVMGTAELYRNHMRDLIRAGFNTTEVWPSEIQRGSVYHDDMLYRVADQVGLTFLGRAGSAGGLIKENKWEDSEERKQWEKLTGIILRRTRNHPSVIMWAHTGNFFGYHQDINPLFMGQDGVLDQTVSKHKMDQGQEVSEVIRSIDPTRPNFAHHGGYVGDMHTANHYLNLIPLQEREEWMSYHVDNADMPYCGIEFGAPDELTFHRNRVFHAKSKVSEPWHTEFSAVYLGPEAYELETDWHRADILAGYKGIEEKKDGPPVYRWHDWRYRARYDELPSFQQVLHLFITNTWRSFRAAGHTGGMLPWSGAHGWTNKEHANPSDPTPWGAERFEDRVVLNEWKPGTRGPWYPYAPVTSLLPVSPKHQEQLPAGDALVANGQPTLAFVAGGSSIYEKTHLFSPGHKVVKQVAIINDTREEQRYQAHVVVRVAGKSIAEVKRSGIAKVGDNVFEKFAFEVPKIEGKLASGEIQLAARIGDAKHSDRFTFRVHAPASKGKRQVAIVDPIGKTRSLLKELGYQVHAWKGGKADLLVVGRGVLSVNPKLPGDLAEYVEGGGRLVVMGQKPDYLRGYGYRVSRHVTRRAWPVGDHPITRGLSGEDFRDWAGADTLVPARNVPKAANQPQPPFGWHWGNRGAVSSGAIEKPHYGGWRPILEAEFDLQYTPLMEMDYGQGKVVWNQLSLEDAAAAGSPAAKLVAGRIIEYAAEGPVTADRTTVYVGGPAGRKMLDSTGLEYTQAGAPQGGLTVVGPNARVSDAALDRYLQGGGHVVFLPRAAGQAPLGVTIERTPEVPELQPWRHDRGSALNLGTPEEWEKLFHGATKTPDWPAAAGLSVSDLRFRSFHATNVLSKGAEIGAAGLLGRKRVGEGTAVFVQADPSIFDVKAQPYFRFTRWRMTRVLSQVLANLGGRFEADADNIHPRPVSLPLAGTWHAKLIEPLPALKDWDQRRKDRPLSKSVKALLMPSVDVNDWAKVPVPAEWNAYGGDWVNIDGEAVYRRWLDLPTGWAGKDLIVELGRFESNKKTIADQDNTFFNGTPIGSASDYWHDRRYEVPGRLVKAGKNLIALRVFNKLYDGGILTMPQMLKIRLKGAQTVAHYHPDYRTDWGEGDEPYRWVRW